MLIKICDTGELFTGTVVYPGYWVADTALEGVDFFVNVKDGVLQEKTVRVDSRYKSYFEEFNQELMYERVIKGITEAEILEVRNSEQEVYIDDGTLDSVPSSSNDGSGTTDSDVPVNINVRDFLDIVSGK